MATSCVCSVMWMRGGWAGIKAGKKTGCIMSKACATASARTHATATAPQSSPRAALRLEVAEEQADPVRGYKNSNYNFRFINHILWWHNRKLNYFGATLLTLSPSPQLPQIVSRPEDINPRLFKLDPALTQELLLEANQRGYEKRLEATILHAPTAAGTLHWHEFVFSLRLVLTEKGWTKKDNRNCPLIISADKSIAIVVMTGNSDTGKDFGKLPTNQADKGAVLDAAIQRNYQYSIFEKDAISELQNSKTGTQLWVLLYHVENGRNGAKEIRVELSLPSNFHKKKISNWFERIILPATPTEPLVSITPSLPAAPIEVSVEFKNGTYSL